MAAEGIDFVVVREGTEGPYVGNGGSLRTGTPHEIATEVSVNTAFGVERVVRDAFAPRRRPGRAGTSRWCTSTTCSPTPGTCGGAPSRRCDAEFPDVETAYQHVDAATIFLVTDPARFDVIVTDNLFGDIITDIAAAIAGGIGLAASRQHQPRADRAEHVRAGARLRAGHRRAGQGRPDRDGAVGRDAAGAPRAWPRRPAASSGPSRRTWPSAAPRPDASHGRRSATRLRRASTG